jgi:DNA primase
MQESAVQNADAKEQVRQATDIVELVGRSIALRRAGRLFKGLCPWHKDTSPSLQVNPDRQTWKCWVCDIGGDAFSFVMKQEGCDFREAVSLLAERAGITLSAQRHAKAEPGSPDDKATLYRCCEWATRQFHEYLLKSEAAAAARRYLAERSISAASIDKFSIGFAPQDYAWLIHRARQTPFTPAVLEAAGLASRYEDSGQYRDFFRGRVMFPIRDTQARPVAFGGRILPEFATERTGKYVNSRETRLYTKSDTLYALDLAKTHVAGTRQLTVVEGYTDVVLCHQEGVHDVVACCGTALTERHIRTLRRFADTIFLVLDGDAAGQRRTNEILELFVAANVDLRILTLPEELDPAEFVLERGGDAFRELLSSAVDALEHKIATSVRGIDLARETHRAHQALEEILATLARGLVASSGDAPAAAAQGLKVQQLLTRLARQFQLGTGDLRTRLAEIRRSSKPAAAAEQHEKLEPAGELIFQLSSLSTAEVELFEIMSLHSELAPVALSDIADDDLTSTAAREILATYRRLEESGQSLDFSVVLGDIENASLKSLLVSIDDLAHEKSPKAILDGPARLRSVIRLIHQTHEDRLCRQTEEVLEQNTLDHEEELEVLTQMIAAKRRQQGLVLPLEG